MVNQIYPTELQVNKANSSDTEPHFWTWGLSITNGIVSAKIHDKREDLNFEIIIVHFLMEMFLAPLSMVYLFVLQKYVLMLMNAKTEIKFWLLIY